MGENRERYSWQTWTIGQEVARSTNQTKRHAHNTHEQPKLRLLFDIFSSRLRVES